MKVQFCHTSAKGGCKTVEESSGAFLKLQIEPADPVLLCADLI